MSTQRTIRALVVLLSLSWLGTSPALAGKAEKLRGYMALSRISMIDAIRTVESQTGGKVYKIELKEDDGRIFYRVEFVSGDETVKTEIDAVIVPQAVSGARVVPPPAVVVPAVPAPAPAQPAPAPQTPRPTQPTEPRGGTMMPAPTAPIEPSSPPTPKPTPIPAGGIVIPFDTEPAGNTPAGFLAAQTNDSGKPAAWKIVADKTAPSQPNAIHVTENTNTGSTFSLLVANQPVLANVEASVRLCVLGGNDVRGGGLVWRYQDAANYYVAAWNKADNALDVWRVKDGKRKRIGTGVVDADPAGWHEIRIEMKGDRIAAYFDGKKMVSERDFTFAEPGKVGFWVMADAQTAFDDLTVTEIQTDAASDK